MSSVKPLRAVVSTERRPRKLRLRKLRPLDYTRVAQATVRESRFPRYLPPGIYEVWMQLPVERPESGEIRMRLYGK